MLQVPLGVVSGTGPELDGTEVHERHGPHVIPHRDLDHAFGLGRLEQGLHLADDRAVIAAPSGEGRPRGREHRGEGPPVFVGHL